MSEQRQLTPEEIHEMQRQIEEVHNARQRWERRLSALAYFTLGCLVTYYCHV
jgi:hypothetical protein